MKTFLLKYVLYKHLDDEDCDEGMLSHYIGFIEPDISLKDLEHEVSMALDSWSNNSISKPVTTWSVQLYNATAIIDSHEFDQLNDEEKERRFIAEPHVDSTNLQYYDYVESLVHAVLDAIHKHETGQKDDLF